MKSRPAGASYARALPIGFLWVIVQSGLYGYVHVNGIGQLIANHLPLASLFFLIVLVLIVNPILVRMSPRLRLTPAELTVIWTMASVAASVPGYGLMEFIFPYIGAPTYFASPENQWREIIFPHLRSWLYVTDAKAARDFWEGLGPNEPVPWRAWIRPAGVAVAFGLVFFFAVGCWSVLIRRQWVERERYAFPLVQVTYHLTAPDPGGRALPAMARSPVFWLGAGAVALVHLFRGLHRLYPIVPNVPLDLPINPFFRVKPWSALIEGWPLLPHVFFSVVGVTYFLQLDVALSLWFFFTLYKLQQVFFTAFGVTSINTQQQVMGAVIVLALVSGWQARRHFAAVLRTVRRPADEDAYDADEPISYRTALIGMTIALVTMAGFLVLMGMSPWLAVLFVLLMWIMATVVAWHVSNAGCLLVNVGFVPYNFFTMIFGSRALGPANLILLSYDRSSIPNWSSQSLMAYAIQDFRLAEMHRLSARKLRLARWMLASVLLAVLVTFVSTLTSIYHGGGLSKTRWIFNVGPWALRRPARAIQNPFPPSVPGLLSAGVGAVVMGFLIFLRHRFLWWPLHPLGYALGVTWAPSRLWFSTIIGWALKIAALSFGGLGAYRRWRPFFLGLIVGEYFMTVVWNLVGLRTGLGYWGPPS